MTRDQLFAYIEDTYGVQPDHPWMRDPESAVFRHLNSKKWFALLTSVKLCRLGMSGEDRIQILNLKCDPLLAASLRGTPGYFPAWHMNKDQWISVRIDSVDETEIRNLIEMSYLLTSRNIKPSCTF